MFITDKSHGEGISCPMCKTLVGTDAVEISDIPNMTGHYHPGCFRVIEDLVRVWRMIGRVGC